MNSHNFHFDNVYTNKPKVFGDIILLQLGDLSCKSNYTVYEHNQDCFEFTYVVSGKGLCKTGEQEKEIEQGEICVSLPGEEHYMKADAVTPMRYFYLAFRVENFEENYSNIAQIVRYFRKSNCSFCRDQNDLYTNFTNLFTEIEHENEYSDLLIENYIRNIIIYVYRNIKNNKKIGYTPTVDKENFVHTLVSYIDTNVCNIEELSDLANVVGYNYSYISHVFSEVMGMSIQSYYQKVRFRRAADWLIYSDITITEIGELLKFNSIHIFSRAFKNHYGVSPQQYRKEHKM